MSTPLRALFVTSSPRQGGAERQSGALVRGLLERGHDCRLVHVKPDGSGNAEAPTLGATRYLDPGAIRRLTAELATLRPSVVVGVNPYSLMYAALALPRSGVRPGLAVTYHSTRLHGFKERVQTAAYRPLFWSADCTIFVCEHQRGYWRRRAVLSRRNEVIYNGVDTAAYSPAPDASTRRAALGFGEHELVIGISAWLRPEKNHVQLVDAVAALRRNGFPARLLVIGDGETRPLVEARARAHGIETSVTITGAQRDVRPCLAACDVVAICSVAVETFSLAALEAMAMGKPVVHADLGGAAEMISNGHNGYVFPVRDTAALTARLAALGDREIARRIGAHAREAVLERFSEGAMIDRYEALLHELCAPRRAHAAS